MIVKYQDCGSPRTDEFDGKIDVEIKGPVVVLKREGENIAFYKLDCLICIKAEP